MISIELFGKGLAMKKNDWILAAVVLLAAFLLLGIYYLIPDQGSTMVEVYVDGELYGSYPLEEEQTVDINGTNRLIIEGGTADMDWADCPDKLCVHQKSISRNGESIICLPNKVVVTIVSNEEPELDAVTY